MRLQALLMLFAALAFSGCSLCPDPEPVYVDRDVDVHIEVPCVIPDVHCATVEEMADMNDSAIVKEAYRCVMEHNEKEKVCQP